MKTCSKCGEEKPLSEYPKHKRCRDGVSGQCKLCVKKIRREYYLKHAEAVKAAERARQRRLSKDPEFMEAERQRRKVSNMTTEQQSKARNGQQIKGQVHRFW